MGGRGTASGFTAKSPKAAAKPVTPSGKTLADVQAMGDQELHDFLVDVNKTDVPDFLNSHHLQRMTYALGMNDKPEIVSQQEFDGMTTGAPFGSGQPIIYRTVNPTDLSGGIHMSAKQVMDQTLYGDLTYQGNGIHGDGIYFSDSKRGSQWGYGVDSGNSRTVACVLNSKAKSITESALQKKYDAFVKTHPQSQKALGFAKTHSSHDSMSQFALQQGYNVIISGSGSEHYYTVLDRGALSTTGKIEKY